MKVPECFASDTEMLSTMLLESLGRRSEIKNQIREFLLDCEDITDEVEQYFLKKVVGLKFEAEINSLDRTIRTTTILIGKNKNMINLEDWEYKVERAKDADIGRVIAHYLNPNNLKKRILCPFHDGKNKHMQIYSQTNSYHCFSCGASGDVIKFVMDYEKCEFKQAINILQNF